MVALLQEAAFPPTSPEGWALLTLVVTSVANGVGIVWTYWTGRSSKASDALASVQTRLIEAAERREREANERADKREETANKRMEAALQGMAQLTQVTTELSTINKTMLEELRRANANYESLSRQRAR